jgi:ATP-dependent RNA helicase DOB1
MAAGTVEDPTYTGPMAKQYPFVLDTFQSISVACLVRVAGSWQGETLQHSSSSSISAAATYQSALLLIF